MSKAEKKEFMNAAGTESTIVDFGGIAKTSAEPLVVENKGTGGEIIATPSTGESAAQNATRGASNPATLVSFGGLAEATDIIMTDATNTTVTGDSYYTATGVTIGGVITLSGTVTANTALASFSADYAPNKTARGVVFTNQSTKAVSSGYISGGTVKSRGEMVAGSYDFYITYPRV